ncbi:MAG: GuaB3 family IMP dehydrogenase-related protein [Acidimicrobiales bacterium]
MAEVEIGAGKQARRGYGLEDVSVVPSRRTRDPEDVDLSWSVEAYKFGVPLIAAASDAVVSPATAVEIGKLGGLAVLNLEGLWTRYDDPGEVLARISRAKPDQATRCLQDAYAEPIKEALVSERIREMSASGITTCASLSPQRTLRFAKAVVDANLDILVIQGTVVSAEHVSKSSEPLDLKTFIRRYDIPVVVGGCASYQAALHLMRTGAVGVLVGVGTGQTSTSRRVLGLGAPHATALADVAGARSRHLEETGVYVHVIADGGMATGGDVTKAIACGADAVMIGSPLAAASGSPGGGRYWEMTAAHERLPRGELLETPVRGTLEEILVGPSHEPSGALNLFGSLRAAMAMCGYASVREFHKAEVVVSG